MLPIRVAWITAPNTSINDPIANGLGSQPGYEVRLFLPSEARHLPLDTSHYTPIYLATRDMTKVVFAPLLFLNKIRGFSNHDLSGTGLISFIGLERALAEFKPDIVFVNGEYNPFVFQVATWCGRARVPYVIQTETQRIDSRYKRCLFTIAWHLRLRRVFAGARAIWAWSNPSARFYASRLSRSFVTTILPGVDTALFRPVRQAKRSGKLEIIVVARLVPFKNISNLLVACASLPPNQWHVTIVGKGPERSALIAESKRLGCADAVTFIEAVPKQMLAKLYTRADVLVLPSYNEAIGMVVPEAMACGTPVIVSDTAGALSYIEEGKTGYIFPTGDTAALARILARFLTRSHAAMGGRAKRSIRASYTVQRTVTDVDALVRRCVSGRHKNSSHSKRQ